MSLQRRPHPNHATGCPDGRERYAPSCRRHADAERAPSGRGGAQRRHLLRCAEAEVEIREYRRQR